MSKDHSDAEEAQENSSLTSTRRGAMALTGLAGLSGLGLASSQSATAKGGGPPHYNWREDVDANGHALEQLGTVAVGTVFIGDDGPIQGIREGALDEENRLRAGGTDALIDDEENGIKLYPGGRWVSDGSDPADYYAEELQDGHHWIEVDE